MKMKFTFDTRIFLLICCLLQGLAGLRLIKVSIPAYKLRGESAMLECQYELDRPYGSTNSRTPTRNRYNHNGGGGGGAGAENGNDMNYIETDSDGDELSVYRHTRTYARQQQVQHTQQQQQQRLQRQHRLKRQQQQQQQQPHFQQYQHQYQPQRSGSGAYYQEQQQQQQYNQQQQQQQQHSYEQQQPYEYQYQTQKSPYGHSVYRGSAFSSSIAAASPSGYGTGAAGGHLGASTYTGYDTHAAIDATAHEDSFGESAEDEDDGDDENEDVMGKAKVKEEALYAIKWYKDNEEFYRYVPKANPQKTSYRFDGVRVVEEHSDNARVLLRGLTLNSSGLYRCEISAEAPNFSSVQGEARMDIVYLPRDGPHIKGQQFQYQIGETLNLNCTSGKSHPASHLQWFINEQPVLDGRYLVPYNDTVHKHGLITSTLGLQLTVDARHFHNGAMRVKCLASISPVLWKGGQESVLQRRPGIIDNREAMLLVRSSASGLHAQQLHPMRNFLSGLRLLTIVAILTTLCQLQLRAELT